MNKNTKFLIRAWIIVGIIGGLVLFGMGAAVWRGEYLAPAVAVTFTTAVLLWNWNKARKARLFFRDETPDRAVAFYHQTMAKSGVKYSAALCAYASGLCLALYGEYDRARDELAGVTWTNCPPMYEGYRTHVLSILAILQEKQFPKALDLALEARDLCDVSTRFPGAAKSKRALETHVFVCTLLNGAGNETTIAALEVAVKDLPGVAPALPAWSLALYYKSNGQEELATTHVATFRRLVPHCAPLMIDDNQRERLPI